jgi:hypothetical protein
MKIYMQNYNPENILKKIQKLDNYFYNKKNSVEIVSDEGVFYIDEKKIYRMNVNLDKMNELKSEHFDLLLDKSTYSMDIIHTIPSQHINLQITTFTYIINNKSKIKLIVEGNYETYEKDKILTNKYYNFIPTNFYFEAPNEKMKNELLNNDDLNVFFSLLN